MVEAGATTEDLVDMFKGAVADLSESKPALLGDLLAGTGEVMTKVARMLGPFGDAAMGAFLVADAKEQGINQATINLTKAAIFYDQTAGPLLRGTVRAMDGLVHSGGHDSWRNLTEKQLRDMDGPNPP